MLSFISSAHAQEATAIAGGSGDFITSILPLILMLGVFYFLLIRPQQKKQTAHKQMVAALRKGDKIVSSGGIYGTIYKVEEELVHVDIAENTRIKLDRSSVAVIVTKPEPTASKK